MLRLAHELITGQKLVYQRCRFLGFGEQEEVPTVDDVKRRIGNQVAMILALIVGTMGCHFQP